MRPLLKALHADPRGHHGLVTLDVAALDLASIEYPALDPDPYVTLFDEMAAAIRNQLGHSSQGSAFIALTNRYLFEDLAFHGNESGYYDPRNSCLNFVLEQRTGIPITLSLVYLEIARRLSKPVFGVGLPGHFVIGYDDGKYSIYIDPFHAGRLLTKRECIALARETSGAEVADDYGILRPVSARYILTRMLNNLQGAYFRSEEYGKALRVLEVLIEADPATADYYKAAAVAHLHLRQYRAANEMFELYLRKSPDASDRPEVAKQMEAIHRWLGSLN